MLVVLRVPGRLAIIRRLGDGLDRPVLDPRNEETPQSYEPENNQNLRPAIHVI